MTLSLFWELQGWVLETITNYLRYFDKLSSNTRECLYNTVKLVQKPTVHLAVTLSAHNNIDCSLSSV